MMTVNQFCQRIPFGFPVELYTFLDRALAERGATADSVDYFRFAKSQNSCILIDRLYSKLLTLARYFLVDPGEINLSNILSNSIRCYDLPLLAQKCDRDFIVPVSTAWNSPYDLSISEYCWPKRSAAISTQNYPRPHLLPRLYGEYFLQAAKMMEFLRYYALNALNSYIDIPACAAGSSCSHIYLIRANRSHWADATEFQLRKLWDAYLAPGRYRLDFFDETTSEEFPFAGFAGYIDLKDNLQFFTQ